MRWHSICLGVLAVITISVSAVAQIPFQIRVTQDLNVGTVANGATLSFLAEIGQSQSAQVVATYRGTGRVTIPNPVELFGPTSFTATSSSNSILLPGESVTLDIQYRPTSSSLATAQLNLLVIEAVTNGTATATTTSSISLSLRGGAPDLSFSYVLQADLNVIPVKPGGAIVFAPTQINTSSQAILSVTNRGSGTGTIKDVSINGDAFRLSGLPFLPLTLDPATELRLNLRYSPTAIQDDTGTIQLTLGDRTVTLNLQGKGAGSSFAYDLVQGGASVPLVPNGSTALSDTALADTSSAVIRIRNTGSASGNITSILLSGAGFQLADLPTLPQTVSPNTSVSFRVTFKPPQAGTFHGTLRIGDDAFDLTARGIGARLVFSFLSNSVPVTLGSGEAVIFSPTPVGQTSKIDFVIRNSGTSAASLANVGIFEAVTRFSLSGLPALPANLEPDKEVRFTIQYSPIDATYSNSTLFINSATVPLIGSGTAPPPLPAYQFEGPGELVDPVAQPAFGITLAAPYSLPLNGVLTLSVEGDTGDDPSVQFSSGGRTVNFTIPANTTKALFGNQATQVRLQTGTVAGGIILTPAFAIQSGGADITPASPVVKRITVAAAAPRLQAIRVDNRAANGFSLVVTGFSTPRTLTDLNLVFTAASGFNLATSQITFHLSADSALWFQSTASRAFGGQFTVSVPFNFQSDNGSTSPADAIKSIAVTATNEKGTSNSIQVDLR